MSEKLNNIPVSMDDDLLSQIDRVAKDMKLSRSAVMRAAIQAGISHVQSGGAADVITLDSEISQFVNELAKHYGKARNSILLEAIRRGVRAVEAHLLHSSPSDISPEVSKMMLDTNPDAEPLLREVRAAKIAKGAIQIQLDDLFRHCPEAKHRADMIEKLATIRRMPGGGGGGSPWGRGLSTEEIEWQVAMSEKHGPNSANWPRTEIERRERVRKVEKRKERKT